MNSNVGASFAQQTYIKEKSRLYLCKLQKLYPSQMIILSIYKSVGETLTVSFVQLSLGHEVHWRIFHLSYPSDLMHEVYKGCILL